METDATHSQPGVEDVNVAGAHGARFTAQTTVKREFTGRVL